MIELNTYVKNNFVSYKRIRPPSLWWLYIQRNCCRSFWILLVLSIIIENYCFCIFRFNYSAHWFRLNLPPLVWKIMFISSTKSFLLLNLILLRPMWYDMSTYFGHYSFFECLENYWVHLVIHVFCVYAPWGSTPNMMRVKNLCVRY